MKCNWKAITREKWKQEAMQVAHDEGMKQAKEIIDRESEDVMRRCFNLCMIAAKDSGLSTRKCKQIMNTLENYTVPTWERMVNSDDCIGKGIGDFWARDQLKAAGYPYYEPLNGEM